jgi:hypothetical protein
MAHRSGWRRLVLVVVLMLVALPAMAGGRVNGKGAEERGFAAVWRAAVRWVVPAGWLAKLGPEIDPDGLTGGSVPPGGSGTSGRGGDLGPEIDPNG